MLFLLLAFITLLLFTIVHILVIRIDLIVRTILTMPT